VAESQELESQNPKYSVFQYMYVTPRPRNSGSTTVFCLNFFLALGICYVVMFVSFCGELRANEGIRRELHESVTI